MNVESTRGKKKGKIEGVKDVSTIFDRCVSFRISFRNEDFFLS